MNIVRRLPRTALLLLRYHRLVAKRQPLSEQDKQQLAPRFYNEVATILGIQCKVTGKCIQEPALIVANHISWHDVIAIGTQVQPDFVAKAEVADWPLIGSLAGMAGTLFIKRGERQAARAIMQAMKERLPLASVLVFPEGTTTLGEHVLPFKRRLFQPSLQLGGWIQPIALHYSGTDRKGHPLGYGQESFLHHVVRTMNARQLTIHIHFCEAFKADKGELKELAEEARARIVEARQQFDLAESP